MKSWLPSLSNMVFKHTLLERCLKPRENVDIHNPPLGFPTLWTKNLETLVQQRSLEEVAQGAGWLFLCWSIQDGLRPKKIFQWEKKKWGANANVVFFVSDVCDPRKTVDSVVGNRWFFRNSIRLQFKSKYLTIQSDTGNPYVLVVDPSVPFVFSSWRTDGDLLS